MSGIVHHLPELGKRTLIMGVLNITPDSFSDGGKYATADAAIARARVLVEEGADLIDVGGESTRPGAQHVSEAEELRRVLPVIEAIASLAPVSIDTTKAPVAAAALDAGAVMVNDISGGTFDAEMRPLVASRRCPFILMHTRARPEVMQDGTWTYEGGVVHAVQARLQELAAEAVAAGIAKENIVVDPGIGFGKTLEENVALLGGIEVFAKLGYPLLVGTSRKSFLGTIAGRPVGERIFATAASVALVAAAGADGWGGGRGGAGLCARGAGGALGAGAGGAGVGGPEGGAMVDAVKVADAVAAARK